MTLITETLLKCQRNVRQIRQASEVIQLNILICTREDQYEIKWNISYVIVFNILVNQERGKTSDDLLSEWTAEGEVQLLQ